MVFIFWFSRHTIIITTHDNYRNMLILLVGKFVGNDSNGNDVCNCHREETGDKKENNKDQSDDVRVYTKVFAEAAAYTANAAIFQGAI